MVFRVESRPPELFGEVPEWSNGPDSKSGVRFSRTVGSNPTLSAKNKKVPLWGLSFLEEGMGFRTLFEPGSGRAAFGAAKRPSHLLRQFEVDCKAPYFQLALTRSDCLIAKLDRLRPSDAARRQYSKFVGLYVLQCRSTMEGRIILEVCNET